MLHTDERSLAAVRIGTGALCLLDLSQRAAGLTTHYTDAGLLPRSALALRDSRLGTLSLHALGGGPTLQIALFAIAGVVAVLLALGWRTRWTAAGLFLMTLSLHNRNPEILYGGDVVLRLLLFWGIFAPLGACWSLDRLREPAPRPRRVACAGVTGLLIQVAAIELFASLQKLQSAQWREGIAVFRWVHLAQLTTGVGQLLQSHPSVCAALARVVLAVQLLGPIALLLPLRAAALRTPVVLALVATHLGMALCLDVGFFSATACVALLAFLPSGFWDRFAPTTPRATTDRASLPRWVTATAGVAIAYVVLLNVVDLVAGARAPRAIVLPAARLGLSQSWGMAAADGYPSGWFVVPGRMADGSAIDLFRRNAPVRWERPALPAAEYPDRFWSLYMEGLWAGRPVLRETFATYFCRRSNVELVQIFWMKETPLPDGRFGPAEKTKLWEQRCD